MSAQVIEFPPSRRRPLNWDEMPDHWEHYEKSMYELMTQYDGKTHEQALNKIEGIVYVRRVIPGESADRRLLRMAQESLASMPKREASGVGAPKAS